MRLIRDGETGGGEGYIYIYIYLELGSGLAAKADDDEGGGGPQRQQEGQPGLESEDLLHGRFHGQQHGGGTDGGGHEEQDQVQHVQRGDASVAGHGGPAAHQEVQHVGHGGRAPAAPLIEQLPEAGRSEGHGHGDCAVLDAVTLLQQQRAQPAVFA